MLREGVAFSSTLDAEVPSSCSRGAEASTHGDASSSIFMFDKSLPTVLKVVLGLAPRSNITFICLGGGGLSSNPGGGLGNLLLG